MPRERRANVSKIAKRSACSRTVRRTGALAIAAARLPRELQVDHGPLAPHHLRERAIPGNALLGHTARRDHGRNRVPTLRAKPRHRHARNTAASSGRTCVRKNSPPCCPTTSFMSSADAVTVRITRTFAGNVTGSHLRPGKLGDVREWAPSARGEPCARSRQPRGHACTDHEDHAPFARRRVQRAREFPAELLLPVRGLHREREDIAHLRHGTVQQIPLWPRPHRWALTQRRPAPAHVRLPRSTRRGSRPRRA